EGVAKTETTKGDTANDAGANPASTNTLPQASQSSTPPTTTTTGPEATAQADREPSSALVR
ncbi:MAG: hypothetical protein N2578_09745, partial [Bdellovibrionaceae bacterium]|nr:hypothetical protein [Pseudobdellovibrionaceae bacterium]